jgi:transposase
MSRKRDRASRSEIEARRLLVERLWIRGMAPSEIAKLFEVSDQTVYRDLEELETSISVEVRRMKLKPVKLALLELRELKRLLWEMLENEIKREGNDLYVRLATIDRIFKIMKEENQLACLYPKDGEEPYVPAPERGEEEFERIRDDMFKRVPSNCLSKILEKEKNS